MTTKGKPLSGKIALVAGATRGAGRGIATALGEAGATVSCTGRSLPGSPGMKNRLETIHETAEIVTARGARGIAGRRLLRVLGKMRYGMPAVRRQRPNS